MYLRIQATPSASAGTPLFGRAVSVSVGLVRSERVNGKPRQKYVGSIIYFTVAGTEAGVKWSPNDFLKRLTELGVPDEKQERLIGELHKLKLAIRKAKHDPGLRKRFQTEPNKVLSELRRQFRSGAVPKEYKGKRG